MKWLWRILKILGLTVVFSVLLLWVTGNDHILRGIPKTYLRGLARPDIDDFDLHDKREVSNGLAEPWPESNKLGKLQLKPEDRDFLEAYDTEAFLVWKGDTLIHEEYWGETTADTYLNSFSMAKSFTSIAVGCAIDEGLITSVEDPLSKYLPEYGEGLSAKVTIKDLLQMASGIDFGESTSSPFGYMAKAYYGTDLEKLTREYRATREPGTYHIYEGGNSVLLGLVVREATGKTVSEYFSEKVWSNIGAEREAYWNIDREGGVEKTFSGFYTIPADFGRFGKLVRDKGNWNGRQIISEDYVQDALTPAGMMDHQGRITDYYGYQLWLNRFEGEDFFFCQGMRGQYIICLPESDIMIVRIGHQRMEKEKQTLPPMVQALIRVGKTMVEQYAEGH